MSSGEDAVKAIGAVLGFCLATLLVFALAAICPLVTIAAVNCAFGTSVPYTFWTWLSVLWLGGVPFIMQGYIKTVFKLFQD